MSEQSTEHVEAQPHSRAYTGECVPKVMKAHVIQARRCANKTPWFLQIYKVRVLFSTRNDKSLVQPGSF